MVSLSELYSLKCFVCGSSFTEKETYTRCLSCGGPLDVVYSYSQVDERLDRMRLRSAPPKASKYAAFYPISNGTKLVSMDEGGTPLLECRVISQKLGCQLLVKNEGINPTGAFKDRGSAVEITKALEAGSKAVCCASTGNMAASVSAYAARVGLPCYVLVPEGTPLGKMAQTLSYGARLLQIKGNYNQAFSLTEELGEKYGYRLMGDYAFRVEGQKSIAYEIVEQLGWQVPDFVVVPIGFGTNLTAIWKGFKEYHKFGFIDKLPRMVGIQASGCCPVVNSFGKGLDVVEPVEKPDTLAGAIAVGDPGDGLKAMAALKESDGIGVAVTDEEMLEAQQMLASKESIFCEPASAGTLAACLKLEKDFAGKKAVLVLTGSGLKDPRSAIKGSTNPPSVEPSFEGVARFVDHKLYNLRSPIRKDLRDFVLFPKTPSKEQVSKAVSKWFDVHANDELASEVREEVSSFLKKGKIVTVSDLRSILSQILTRPPVARQVLHIVEFAVTEKSGSRPEAKVKVKFLEETLASGASGDGPVDAAINAVRKALHVKGIPFKLTDFSVVISAGGTEATVDVSMSLQDTYGNTVVGSGASPDVVVASLKAFESAYNTLYWKYKAEADLENKNKD